MLGLSIGQMQERTGINIWALPGSSLSVAIVGRKAAHLIPDLLSAGCSHPNIGSLANSAADC